MNKKKEALRHIFVLIGFELEEFRDFRASTIFQLNESFW